MATSVDVTNLHSVKLWVKERIKAGAFKSCRHLTIKGPVRAYSRVTCFVPWCERKSFEWPRYGPGLDDQFQFEILVSQLSQEPIKCPANCSCYESRKWAKVKAALGYVPSRLKRYLDRFLALPWQTQVAIISALLLLAVFTLAPQWVPFITEMIRAWRGK